jgi:putative tricarboxylic transport membrane protein
VRTDVAPGIRQPTDIVKAKGIVSGGLGPDSGKDLLIRLGLDILGVPDKHITPYRNSAQARLALQQGEINFYSESPPSYRTVVHTGIVKDGLAIPVWHDPDFDGETPSASSQVADLAIPAYHELYRTIYGKLPSGEMWDVYRTIRTISGSMLRLVALPPGAPPAAADALSAAVMRLAADPAYAEDAMKTLGFVPEYAAGPRTNQQVRDGLSVSPEIRTFITDYVKKGAK